MRPVGTASVVDEPDAAPPEESRRRRRVLLSCAAVLVLLLAGAVWWIGSAGPPPLTPADVDKAVQRGLAQAQEEERNTPPDASTAYRTIGPSLVTVSASGSGGAGGKLGSGVIINAAGAVLTALHVVDGSGAIRVEFADGTAAAAHISTSQAENDIAVLAVDQLPQVVVPAVIAGPPPVGDTVFAVGNPMGLQRSLSAGVVSATGRSVATEGGAGDKTLDGLIQFDAAVNPGNSGGPLLNRAGQVVGIVTGLANPTKQDFFVGIGFAVPIATASGAAGGPQK